MNAGYQIPSKDLTQMQKGEFLKHLPKCQLHIHIEGTLEPEMIFQIAKRNGIKIKSNTIEELRQLYQFNNLQSFLDIYYQGCSVLTKQEDFYDLALAYLKKCQENNVVHTEIFVDPQTHHSNGVPFATVINGIDRARKFAQENWGISSYIIVCFLRDHDEESALRTFQQVLSFKEKIKGFGLDSNQNGNPPRKFIKVYEKARAEGFEVVAHAGEQGPPQYVWEALELLKVKRIDHGIRSLEDDKLVQKLAKQKIPLTVCPLSNYRLKIYPKISDIPIKKMMSKGLLITINSDDPAYFHGYVNQNFLQIIQHLPLTNKQVIQLVKNSFIASFLPENLKQTWIQKLSQLKIQ